MNTLKDRLQELMAEHGLRTQNQLADFAKVSKGLVNQWFQGDTGLGKKPLLVFEQKTRYSGQWLANGTGPKYKQIATTQDLQDDVYLPGHHDALSLLEHSNNDMLQVTAEQTIRLSKSALLQHQINPNQVVCTVVDGDAMSPAMVDGSIIGIDTGNQNIRDGKIYAINHGGLLRINVITKRPNQQLLLHSFNHQHYPDEIISQNDICIIGRVFWWSTMV